MEKLVGGLPNLLNSDGGINTTAIDEAPAALAEFMFTILDLNPGTACVKDEVLKIEQSKLESLLREIMSPVLDVLNPVMKWANNATIFLVGGGVELAVDGIEDILEATIVGQKLEELDTTVSANIDAFCQKTTKTVLGFLDDVGSIPTEFCQRNESPSLRISKEASLP